MLFIAVAIKLQSPGSVLYWSDRVGLNNVIFKMPKFRSMFMDAPAVATHLLKNPSDYITPFGAFLRKSSLDELPQLLSVLLGNMSFVGPRPALYNQYDLIELRTNKGVHTIIPGITGLAQINGRDELSIEAKVEWDYAYFVSRSFFYDLYILFKTLLVVLTSRDVSH